MATSNAKTWKGKQTKKAQDLELPSGNTVVIKRVPIEDLLASGVIPNSLIGIITDQIAENAGDKPMTEEDKKKLLEQQLEDVKNDPSRLADLAVMASNVALAIMKEPKLHPLPEDDDDRDEDLLYVDDVTMEDKMFMFNVAVGGSEDLERFRDEATSIVHPSQDRPKPRKAAKRTAKR